MWIASRGQQYAYPPDACFAIFSKNPIESYQINESNSNIQSGEIGGKDYIGMSTDSSMKYKVGMLKPGESKTISIFVYFVSSIYFWL